MILFFDTNILLDVALRRDPHLAQSQALLSDAIRNHTCFLSWHSISYVAYILGKLESKEDALTFIKEITKVCTIAPVEHKDLAVALQHNSGDLEDAMQIASALVVQAETIVTRDPRGFRKSPIALSNPANS
jgi:predicted nucleic acid-binding protein